MSRYRAMTDMSYFILGIELEQLPMSFIAISLCSHYASLGPGKMEEPEMNKIFKS